MTRDELKVFIVKKVTEANGIKGTQLVADIAIEPGIRECLGTHEIPDLLDELVSEGSIVEIEFIVPRMTYKIKSFYLPKGSEITIKSGNSSRAFAAFVM